MTDSGIAGHIDAAEHHRGVAEKDFRDAALTAAGFAMATLIAREAIELVLPDNKFREEISTRIVTLGLATAGAVFGAGSIAASRAKYHEIQELRAAEELKKN